MPRAALDLTNPEHLALVGGQWRFGPGLVPGEPNEGLVALLENSPARLPDYDDSSWEVIDDIGQWRSSRLTFGWYRTKLVIPEQVNGRDTKGARSYFETCIDDYGEVWVNGEIDLVRGSVQGFNIPQRVPLAVETEPGAEYTIAMLAINGPLARPGGAIFVRYATLALEWRGEGY